MAKCIIILLIFVTTTTSSPIFGSRMEIIRKSPYEILIRYRINPTQSITTRIIPINTNKLTATTLSIRNAIKTTTTSLNLNPTTILRTVTTENPKTPVPFTNTKEFTKATPSSDFTPSITPVKNVKMSKSLTKSQTEITSDNTPSELITFAKATTTEIPKSNKDTTATKRIFISDPTWATTETQIKSTTNKIMTNNGNTNGQTGSIPTTKRVNILSQIVNSNKSTQSTTETSARSTKRTTIPTNVNQNPAKLKNASSLSSSTRKVSTIVTFFLSNRQPHENTFTAVSTKTPSNATSTNKNIPFIISTESSSTSSTTRAAESTEPFLLYHLQPLQQLELQTAQNQ
ncbi:integumentary mucin C.1-like [Teleopsis dalmanni]|uniref:integumentary mucin C.1-like n=1 Tax=Teleopsis dalmanni TaxID=139649 RepID=UPI0018CE697E|nr:integumentary mucin C.1-like [Teleopsis dalmanni]